MTFDEMANELNVVGWLVLPPADAAAFIREKKELVAVLEKIASLRYSNISAASIAQSALDTMRALEKP